MLTPHLLSTLLSLGAAWSGVSAASHAPPQEPARGRVVVIGMDGMDASMAEEWMNQGLLPNFARLRAQGTFAPLMPANPAQSPVSWATLNSGQNPGKHGIFDFIGINRPKDAAPSPTLGFTMTRKITAAEAGLPFTSPGMVWLLIGGGAAAGLLLGFLLRKRAGRPVAVIAGLGVAGFCGWYGLGWLDAYPRGAFLTTYVKGSRVRDFWQELDAAGVPFRGQGTVVSYPPEKLEHGKLLAGLGAPDATGGLNGSEIWTTAEKRVRLRREYLAAPAYSEADAPRPGAASGNTYGTVRVFRLVESAPGVWDSKIAGPVNQARVEALRAELAAAQEARNSGGGAAAAAEITRLSQLLSPNGGYGQLSTWAPMRVEWRPGAREARVSLDGVAQTIPLGSWSDYYHVVFPWTARFSTSANVRLWVEEIDGALEIYANPLQIDPADPYPGSELSSPASFAVELEKTHGPFETLGWACQTHAVKDAELSDRAFLLDIEHIYAQRLEFLRDALRDPSWRVLFHFFGEPDRVCHMLMRHMDPQHPQYDAALADEEVTVFGKPVKMRDAGLVIYQQMDAVVGELMDKWLKPDDVLLIVSDHGFDSFRREVDLNAWMVQEGFMAVNNRDRLGNPRTAADMRVDRDKLAWVDWEHSSAYSMAIGKIYLNLRGRERYGIVDPAKEDEILSAITSRLYELRDPANGEKVVRKVYRKQEIYRGGYLEAQAPPAGMEGLPAYGGAAELTVDFAPGYRCSWSSTTGSANLVDVVNAQGETIGTFGPAITDNTLPWSGDHCGVDMEAVQGIFFCNRPTRLPAGASFYDATHLAPTVLALEGVPVPAEYDAQPLVVQ